MKRFFLLLVSLLFVQLVSFVPVLAANITIDNSVQHQTWEGFGADQVPLFYGGCGPGDVVPPVMRDQASQYIYGQNAVHITLGDINATAQELAPGCGFNPQNDNNDPQNINWSGFKIDSLPAFKNLVLGKAPGGLDLYMGHRVSTRWGSPWLTQLLEDGKRNNNINPFLDEAAEQVVATYKAARDAGFPSNYLSTDHLFNETMSGNGEIPGVDASILAELMVRVNARLQNPGGGITSFGNVKFVIPNEERVSYSYDAASQILANSAAKQVTSAIGYHPYPYDSAYTNIAKLLATSGNGNPDSGEVAIRQNLRNLGRQYGLPLWMTEVSNGGEHALNFKTLRGRAIHIHDEMLYTEASAFFPISTMWDTNSNEAHFQGSTDIFTGDGAVVLIDDDLAASGRPNRVYISGIGYAVGHYSQFIDKGTKVIDAQSSDPRVQVSAFNNGGQLVLVIINNNGSDQTVNVSLKNISVNANSLGGIESRDSGISENGSNFLTSYNQNYWRPISKAITPGSNFSFSVPSLSVTTLSTAASNIPPSDTHKECDAQTQTCKLVQGGGPNLCINDNQCKSSNDIIPPTISSFTTSLPSPQAVDTKIGLTAIAADNVSVGAIEFYVLVDGNWKFLDGCSGAGTTNCTVSWDTLGYLAGTYQIKVRVVDTSDNAAEKQMSYVLTAASPIGSQTHLECFNQSCVSFQGPGQDKCTDDAQCQSPPITEVCGDNACSASESCSSCPGDCGVCGGPIPPAGCLPRPPCLDDPVHRCLFAEPAGGWCPPNPGVTVPPGHGGTPPPSSGGHDGTPPSSGGSTTGGGTSPQSLPDAHGPASIAPGAPFLGGAVLLLLIGAALFLH